MAVEDRVSGKQNTYVFNNLSNENHHPQFVEEPRQLNAYITPVHPGGPSIKHQGQDTFTPRGNLKLRHSIHAPADKLSGSKQAPTQRHPPKPNKWKRHKKRERDPANVPPPPPTQPEACITLLPAGARFPKKPSGCVIIPQTIEPRAGERSTVYFTRNGVLGIPLRYMHNLNDMDDGEEPANLGVDPMKSCTITLVVAWPGYKEAAYDIVVYIPLYPTAPFVTIYGLRQLTKRELAVEILRRIHQWMIEHPWGGERHTGLPEWKLGGENAPGVSAKRIWLSMISPVGNGRWVTQLQKAPGFT